jgi:hypothetical protein
LFGIDCVVITACIMICKSIDAIMTNSISGACNERPNFISPVGTIVFAFATQIQIPSLFTELKDPHSHERHYSGSSSLFCLFSMGMRMGSR